MISKAFILQCFLSPILWFLKNKRAGRFSRPFTLTPSTSLRADLSLERLCRNSKKTIEILLLTCYASVVCRTLKRNHREQSHVFNYPVLVQYEKGKYIASCPYFSGCVVQMDTYEDALKEISIGIKTYIEIHLEKNWPLPSETIPAMTVLQIAAQI